MLTLRLIFYGLVAFVPSLNGEGAMVVFPSAEGVVDAHGCTIPTHHPRAFKVGYSADNKPEALDEIEIPGGLPAYAEVEYSPEVGLSLAGGLRFAPNGGELIVPSDSDQVLDLSWIPALGRLNPPSAEIRSECLFHPSQCKISLSVRMWQTDAHVCHLAHPRKDVEKFRTTCGILGPVLAYRFKDLGEASNTAQAFQAVSDAFEVRLTFNPDRTPRLRLVHPQGDDTYYDIPFDDTLTTTILLANLPPAEHVPERRCASSGVDRHFYSYYDLGMYDPQYYSLLPLPTATDEKANPGIEMPCEGEITQLEYKLIADYRKKKDNEACIDAKPHSVEVCSTTQFQATVLPSLRSNPPAVLSKADFVKNSASEREIVPPRPAPNVKSTGVAARSLRSVAAPTAPTASTAPTPPPN